MDIQNKSVLITGAGSGLGAATARLLAKHKANVILVDKNNDAVSQIADEIQGMAFAADVTDEASVQSVLSHCKQIHAVINCAGIVHAARIVGKNGPLPLKDFSNVIQVNLIGTFNVMRLCAEKMMQQAPVNAEGERGVIINTASVAAFEGQLGQIAYSASKGAIHSMSLPAARELCQYGIRVMAIAPGIMETPMMAGMPEKVQTALASHVLFPKQLGDPTDFAKLVFHIIQNVYLNGSTIRLDGGIRLG